MEHIPGRFCTIWILALVIIGALSSCRQLERITTERTVRVDSVEVPVVTPAHDTLTSFAAGDSLLFEDDRIRLRIVPVFDDLMPEDMRQHADPVPIGDEQHAGSVPPVPTGYQVEASIKPDTGFVKVPQTTITERTQRTVTETKTGWMAWITIGGLLAVVIILLVAFRIRT